MARINTTRVSVEGSRPKSQCIAGSASHSSARISAYRADLVGKCLNSSPSEMEAAAATLLVVVPAKPLRAKQRLAAPRINCRRKSPVMRRVLMVVSKHSPYQKSILPQCTRDISSLNGTKSQRAADPRHDKGAVATGEHALQIGAVDLDADKARPAGDVLNDGGKGLGGGHGGDRAGIGYPARPVIRDQVDICRVVAPVHAGLAIT